MKALLAASTLATTVAIACGTVKVDTWIVSQGMVESDHGFVCTKENSPCANLAAPPGISQEK